MARTPSQVGKSNSRNGKSFERRIAKLLTEWAGTEFRRRLVESRDTSIIARCSTADVIPSHHNFRFSIEAKSGAGFSLDALLANPTATKVSAWWGQCTHDANLLTEALGTDIHPMLFFKPNSGALWIAFPKEAETHLIFKDGWSSLPSLTYCGYKEVNPIKCNISFTKNKKYIDIELPDMIFCRWQDFATRISPLNLLMKRN